MSTERVCVRNDAMALLLESFARQSRYVTPDATSLELVDDLPPALRAQALALEGEATWCAWRQDGRMWFLAGRIPSGAEGCTAMPALEVLFFSLSGEAVAAGAWILTARGEWALRCAMDGVDFMRSSRPGPVPAIPAQSGRDRVVQASNRTLEPVPSDAGVLVGKLEDKAGSADIGRVTGAWMVVNAELRGE